MSSLAAIFVFLFLSTAVQERESPGLQQVVLEAFTAASNGYSSDEVILDDKLNAAFLKACKSKLPDMDALKCNWQLMNMRKAGKLSEIKTTKRNRIATESVMHIAEIVSRGMMDRHSISIDRVMADPKMRKEFDKLVADIDNKLDLYQVRKAAFKLRKSRKLKPELITRVADWDRKIIKVAVSKFESAKDVIPENPGVYIFHDESGYLYIGQSDNVHERLKEHLESSSNAALGKYLQKADSGEIWIEIHSFPKDSRAKEVMVRRAYESELIRSRKPKFNILP